MPFKRAGETSFDMLAVATRASRADAPLLRPIVGRASQGFQHKRLRPQGRCLLAALPRLQRTRAQSVYQSGGHRLRIPLPTAHGLQLFGETHGLIAHRSSIRETRIVINHETDVAQRGAIPPPNLQYRGTAKTAKNLSRDLFSMRVPKGFHLWNQAKPALLKNLYDRIWDDEIQFTSPSRSASGRGCDRQTQACSG